MTGGKVAGGAAARRRPRALGVVGWLSAAGAAAVTAAAVATPALAFTASPQLQQAVTAATPSVVHVILDVSGSLRDTATGQVRGPFHDTLTGTGWFADPDGDILTAGHVAAPTPEEVKETLANVYIEQDLCGAAADCSGVLRDRLAGILDSSTAVDPVVGLRVLTQDVKLGAGATAHDAYVAGVPATVVTSSPSSSRDLAVIHIASHGDPAVLVRPSLPARGAQVGLVGFPPSATFAVPPTFGYGSVVGITHGPPGQQAGTPAIAVDATLIQVDVHAEHGDSGGPVVDETGAVVGLVSFGDDTGRVNVGFLISQSDIAGILGEAGLRNTLGPADTDWRDGLAADGRGDHAGALALFRRCIAESPLNTGCQAAIATASGTTGSSVSLVLVAAVVVAVAAATGGGVVVLRRRARARRRRALFRA